MTHSTRPPKTALATPPGVASVEPGMGIFLVSAPAYGDVSRLADALNLRLRTEARRGHAWSAADGRTIRVRIEASAEVLARKLACELIGEAQWGIPRLAQATVEPVPAPPTTLVRFAHLAREHSTPDKDAPDDARRTRYYHVTADARMARYYDATAPLWRLQLDVLRVEPAQPRGATWSTAMAGAGDADLIGCYTFEDDRLSRQAGMSLCYDHRGLLDLCYPSGVDGVVQRLDGVVLHLRVAEAVRCDAAGVPIEEAP